MKSELCDFVCSHVRRLREAEFGTDCSKNCSCERLILGDRYTSGGQESAQLSRLLDVLLSLCENAANSGLAWSFSRWSDSSACSARTQGALKTRPAPDESSVSVRSDNSYIMGIRFGAMGPWSQPYFMDLVRVGEFVLAYLPKPTSYGHETCTIGYSKDWGLKGCVEILWQPHQIWSYGPMKSAMFHGFGLGWLICDTISPEPYKLWTWNLSHWIQHVVLQSIEAHWDATLDSLVALMGWQSHAL